MTPTNSTSALHSAEQAADWHTLEKVVATLPKVDRQIWHLACLGATNRDISQNMTWGTDYVVKRLAHVCRLIGARNRWHAAGLGALLGVVTAADLPDMVAELPVLTHGDARILADAVAGMTTKDSAPHLGLLYGTVLHGRRRLYRMFRVCGLAPLVSAAVLLGAVNARVVDPRFPDQPLSALNGPNTGGVS